MTSPDREQEFYHAIEAGQTDTVEAYLEDGFPVNDVYTNIHGQTPLHQASAHGHVEITEILLRYGANVNTQTAYKQTPLHEAAYNGHIRIVEILLNHGANLDVKDIHGETALQMALRNNKMDTTDILISKGANLVIKDNSNITPLHWASRHGQKELVKRLLAVPEINVNASDNNGWTPLFESALYSKTDVMELLLKHGAKVNYQENKGWTTLHYASANGREDVIHVLLKYNADASIRDEKNETARQKACTNGKWDIVKLLLDFGDNIDEKDTQGRTLLHRSSTNCQNDIMRALLEKGSDIDIRDEKGWTALHCAIHSGQAEAVKLLLDKKANVNIADNEGYTPLYRASVRGDEDILNIVLNHGAKVHKTDKKGWTPLHYAASCGKQNVVKILIDKMQDVDVVDKEGLTPLHVAVNYGYPAVVKELLISGAEIKPTSTTKTPFQLAEEQERSDIVKVFKDFLADGLPIEVKLLDSQLADGFERSLRYGFYYSYLGKIMFVGNEAVGKTTITRLLLGKKPKKKRKPTEGIDMHVNRAAIDRESRQLIPKALKFEDTAYSNLFMRKTEDAKGMPVWSLKEVTQMSIRRKNIDTEAIPEIIEPNSDIDANSNTTNPSSDIAANLYLNEPIFDDDDTSENLSYRYIVQDYDDDNETSISSIDFQGPDSPNSPMKRTFSLRSLTGKQKRPKTSKEYREQSKKIFRLGARRAGSKGLHKKKEAPVIILDFAGQEVFYSTHQSFLTHRGVYVIVINGSLNLDEFIESEVFIPGRHEKPTTRGYIKFWVNSILCYCKGKSKSFPKIVICCTHKDKIEMKDIHKQRKYIFDEIDKMFSDSPANTHLITQHRIFINAVDQSDPEIGILKTVLVEMIMTQPTWGEKMPKSWIHLEMEINKKARDGDKILTMQKLKKLNRLNPAKVLPEDELNLFLRVHHSIGDLMYFPMPELRDHVIISPSFLIDALKMIVTDKRFVKDKILDIWKCLESEGKIRKKELSKLFDNHAEFKKYKNFLINLMCHLDLLTDPRSFDPDTGNTVISDFFYVPCMVKSGSAEIHLDQSIWSNAIGFSFKFNTSILPSAIGFRLIASCLDLWKVAEYQKKNLLFSGIVVVVYNKFVRLIVKNKNDRIDIFLSHTTSRYDIKAQTATSIRVCLTDILQRITDSYKVLSTGTSDHATSSFQVEYTCYNVISPCYCQERMEWTCCHGDLITQDILNKWSIDRTITDIDCSTDCKGLPTDALQHMPSELHLGKLALHFEWENLKPVLLNLGILNNEMEAIQFNNQYQGLDNIKFHCLKKWTMKQPSCTFDKLKRAIEEDSQDPHILCKAFRDRPFKTNLANEILERKPTDKDLHSIASSTVTESLLICVHLGIDANDWIKMHADRYPIVDITENILKQWRDNHPGKPKLRELAEAFCNVGMSIEILLADSA